MADFADSKRLPDFSLWEKLKRGGKHLSFSLEVTARCNNHCRHCYINLPAHEDKAKKKELTLSEIGSIACQAVDRGAFWCLITGGEPLLREDFPELYLCLKRKGLLVSVFTNAALIREKHIELFGKYPPRDIEVTVYGVTEKTYEAVTRVKGSFKAFMRGLDLLLKGGVRVRFKTMALRSNFHELPQIAEFCRQRTKDFFRFDPFLTLRYDRDPGRNQEIRSERLSPEEVVAVERADKERFGALEKNCEKVTFSEAAHNSCGHLFRCGAGNGSFSVSYDGYFRLCAGLCHPDCSYDLRKGTLQEACEKFVPAVRDMRSRNKEFLTKCRVCPIINLCLWCPATAHLETGKMDSPVESFCRVAHERHRALSGNDGKK